MDLSPGTHHVGIFVETAKLDSQSPGPESGCAVKVICGEL